MKLFRDGSVKIPHIVSDGVHFRDDTWGFSFADSFGRRTFKTGYSSRTAALSAFDGVQREYLSPEFVKVLSKELRDRNDSLPASLVAKSNVYDAFSEAIRETGKTSCIYPLNTVAKLTDTECISINNKLVNKASVAWQNRDEGKDSAALFIAARIRQLQDVPRAEKVYKTIFKYICRPNWSARHTVDLLKDIQRDLPISKSLTPCILKFLGLDKDPFVGGLLPHKTNFEAAFFKSPTVNAVAFRDEEKFPNGSNPRCETFNKVEQQVDSNPRFETFKAEQQTLVEAELANLLRFQHTWAVFSPTFSAPSDHLVTCLDRMGLCDVGVYGDASDGVLSRLEENEEFVGNVEWVTQAAVEFNLLSKSNDSLILKENTVKLSPLLNQLRRTSLGLEETPNSSSLNNLAVIVENRMFQYSALDAAYVSCISDTLGLPPGLVEAGSNSAVVEIADPRALKHAKMFRETMEDLLPYGMRSEFFSILKRHRDSMDENLRFVHLKVGDVQVLHLKTARDMALVLGPHFNQLAPLFSQFIKVESFRNLLGISHVWNEWDISQARLCPETIENHQPTKIETSPLLENRRVRSGQLPGGFFQDKGLPEFMGGSWKGLNGSDHASVDEAIATWFTMDIVGGAGTLESESSAWCALETAVRLATTGQQGELLELHNMIRPESISNVYWTAHQLVEEMDQITRVQFYNELKKFWIAPELSFDTNGVVSVTESQQPFSRDELVLSLQSLLESQSQVPYIIQNLHSLTPERIEGIAMMLDPDSTSSARKQLLSNSQISLKVSDELDNREASYIQDVNLQVASGDRRWFPDRSVTGSTTAASGDEDEDWVMRTIYCNNIPTNLDSNCLKAFFEKSFGSVENISVHTERTLACANSDKLISDHGGDLEKYKAELYSAFSSSNSKKLKSKGNIAAAVAESSESFDYPARASQVFSVKSGSKRIRQNAEFFKHLALDHSYSLDKNWNRSTVLAESRNSANPLKSITSEKLSVKLLSMTDDLTQELEVLSEISARIQSSHSRLLDAWDAYLTVLHFVPHSFTEIPISKNIFELKGDEVLGDDDDEETKIVRLRLLDKYSKYKNAVRFGDDLLRVYPKVCRTVATKMEDLLVHLNEAAIRQSIHSVAVAAPVIRKWTFEGIFGGKEDSSEDEELDEEELQDQIVEHVEELTLTDSERDNLTQFKNLYNSLANRNVSERFDKASSLNKASKSRKRVNSAQLLPKIIPKSGAYAFITFADHESFRKATTQAMRLFGVTIGVEQYSTEVSVPNVEKFLNPDLKSHGLQHHNAKVEPGCNRKGLYIEGFRKGLHSTEISEFLTYILRPAFPGIKFDDDTSLTSVLGDGACFVQFKSHAESRVAYELLKDQIVLGGKLVVGWREREPTCNMERSTEKTNQDRSMMRYIGI